MIEYLHELDRNLFIVMNSFHHPWLDTLMSILSGQLIWAPMIFFFIFYARQVVSPKFTLMFTFLLLLTLIASDVSSSYVLKNLVDRLRPCRLEELRTYIYDFGQKCGGKYGFVSSHAANSVALVFFSLRSLPVKKSFYWFWLLPLLVGHSRIYMGVHYPGDILGGALVGLIWGGVFSWILKNSKGQDDS